MNELTIERLQTLCVLARAYFETDHLIIAGGAPRDILHCKPVKDIDIFVQVTLEQLAPPSAGFNDFEFVAPCASTDSTFQAQCKAFAEALNGTAEFRKGPEAYGDLADLCDIKTQSYPVQIIALFQDPVDDVHGYDFGISQVFVTPRGVFSSARAVEDDLNCKVTYLREGDATPAQIERSRKRLARLREKYKHWNFKQCESLDAEPEVTS